MDRKKIVNYSFLFIVGILLLSSIMSARIDIHGTNHTVTHSGNNEHSIIFYNNTGNDSILYFESDLHDTYVMSLNGTTGLATFYSNVSMLENATIVNNILPNATNISSIGLNELWWDKGYIRTLYADTLTVDGNFSVLDESYLNDVDISENLTVDGKSQFNDNVTIAEGKNITGNDFGARVNRTTHQSIPTVTYTIINFTNEEWDTDNIHDNDSYNSRLTCNTSGVYMICLNYRWSTIAYNKLHYGGIRLNGLKTIARTQGYGSYSIFNDISTIYRLEKGDYVEARVYHNSPTAEDIQYNIGWSPTFMMQRIAG